MGTLSTEIKQLTQINSNELKSNVGFWGEGKTGVPVEKLRGAQERTNKLNPHMTPSLVSNPGHIDVRRVFSTMHHPCTHNVIKQLGIFELIQPQFQSESASADSL